MSIKTIFPLLLLAVSLNGMSLDLERQQEQIDRTLQAFEAGSGQVIFAAERSLDEPVIKDLKIKVSLLQDQERVAQSIQRFLDDKARELPQLQSSITTARLQASQRAAEITALRQRLEAKIAELRTEATLVLHGSQREELMAELTSASQSFEQEQRKRVKGIDYITSKERLERALRSAKELRWEVPVDESAPLETAIANAERLLAGVETYQWPEQGGRRLGGR